MENHTNGWKRRPLRAAFADGFQGIAQASCERIMRIVYVCIAAAIVVGWMRELKPLGWIFLTAHAGVLMALEHVNNVVERQEVRFNRLKMALGHANDEWNEHSRYILHQMTVAVLIWGISGLVGGILVLLYNP